MEDEIKKLRPLLIKTFEDLNYEDKLLYTLANGILDLIDKLHKRIEVLEKGHKKLCDPDFIELAKLEKAKRIEALEQKLEAKEDK